MKLFPAGIGPIHVARLIQWIIAAPIAWSFFAGILDIGLIDPLMQLSKGVGIDPVYTRWLLAGVAIALSVSEGRIEEGEAKFAHDLHALIKVIGDEVTEGRAIETAVASAAKKGAGPAGLFRDALEEARDMPFETALRAVASQSGSPYFMEVAGLVSMAMDSPGDTGHALRSLGSELEKSYRLGTSLYASLYASLRILRGTALLAAPPLFRLLQYSYHTNILKSTSEWQVPLEPAMFYAYGGLIAAAVDGILLDRWDWVPARVPLNLAIVYGGLHFI